MYRSVSALLECGIIYKKDVVALNNGIVGQIVCFWRHASYANEFHAQINEFDVINEGGSQYYRESAGRLSFTNANAIVDACTWVYKRPGVMKVLLPFALCARW